VKVATHYYFATWGVWSNVICMTVCESVCLSVHLHISKIHVQTRLNFLYIIPVAVALSSDSSVIHYNYTELPVSFVDVVMFHIMGQMQARVQDWSLWCSKWFTMTRQVALELNVLSSIALFDVIVSNIIKGCWNVDVTLQIHSPCDGTILTLLRVNFQV